MSPTKIKKLTAEQEALIPVYREKWRAMRKPPQGSALSTEPLDRQKATEAVKAAYAAIGEKEPEIIFCDSPYAAYSVVLSLVESQLESQFRSLLGSRLRTELRNQLENQLRRQFRILLGRQLRTKLETQLKKQLSSQLRSQLWIFVWIQLANQLSLLNSREVWSQLRSQLWNQLESQLWNQLERQLKYNLRSLMSSLYSNYIQPETWAGQARLFDFCINVLNCDHDKKQGEAFLSLVKSYGWIYPFEKICVVCSRPIKLSFDSEYRLHAVGEPAMKFADGYSLYSYHGVTLPEKYGAVHPHQWRAQWLLEEDNAELRRVLIQEIGYARICQELQATKLDWWQEYTLLKIDNDLDVEPIYLLKMTCPSTGFIHALRVPPDMQSAREAIRWVNWGISPEEFSIQT